MILNPTDTHSKALLKSVDSVTKHLSVLKTLPGYLAHRCGIHAIMTIGALYLYLQSKEPAAGVFLTLLSVMFLMRLALAKQAMKAVVTLALYDTLETWPQMIKYINENGVNKETQKVLISNLNVPDYYEFN